MMTTDIRKPVEIRDEFLKCVQCTEKFEGEDKPPRVLKCLHIICTPCLTKLLKGNRAKCPKCQHDIHKSESDIPIDHTKEDLIDFERSFRDTSKKTCEMCNANADIRCGDCYMFLCNECSSKIHKYQSHKTVDISDVTRPAEFSYTLRCQKEGHDRYPLKYYCESCEIALCSECFIEAHSEKKHHNIKNLSTKFEETTKLLLEKQDSMTATLHNISSLQEEIGVEKENVRRNSTAAEHKVNFHFNLLIQMLEKRKEVLLHEIDKRSKEKWKILTDQGTELDSLRKQLSYSVRFLEHSSLSQNQVGFLGLASTISGRFKELTTVEYDPVPRVNGEIEFLWKTKDTCHKGNIIDMIPVHGVISSPMMYCPKCEVTTIPVKGNDEEKRVRLCLKNYLGDEVDDEIIIESGVCIDRSTGKESEFIKDKPGVYTSGEAIKDMDGHDIKIKVNGKVLKDVRGLANSDKLNYTEGKHSTEEGIQRKTTENEWKLLEEISTPKETRCAIVECFCESDTTKDDIETYFNNQPCPGSRAVAKVVEVNMNEDSCIVSFIDQKVARNFLNRKHKIKGHDIIMKPFYHTPSPLIFHIDLQKLSFIVKSEERKHDLEDVLTCLYAKVDWEISKQNLKLSCTLKPNVSEDHTKFAYWHVMVTQRVLEFVEMIYVMNIRIAREKWNAIRQTNVEVLHQLDRSKVDIVVDGKENSVSIIGYKVQFEEAESKIREQLQGIFHPSIHIECGADSSAKKVKQFIHKLNKESCIFLQTEAVQNEMSGILSAQNISCSIETDNSESVFFYTYQEKKANEKNGILDIIEQITAFYTIPGQASEEFNKEVEDINSKTKGMVYILRTERHETAICAIRKPTARVIIEHLKMILKYPDGGVRCKAHYLSSAQRTISVFHGDITKLETDTIVCSSDKYLKLGIGVGKDLVAKGGRSVQDECIEYIKQARNNELAEWEVFSGTAGQLQFKKIIHIPGKKWQERFDIPEKDRQYYIHLVQMSLVKANELGYKSVALPALCCGNNEYPVELGAVWMVEAIHSYLSQNVSSLTTFFLCDLNENAVKKFVETLGKKFQPVFVKA